MATYPPCKPFFHKWILYFRRYMSLITNCFTSLGPTEEKVEVVHIVIGTSISVFFCIILIVCGVYHREKLRPRDRHYQETDHVEVRYVAATSGSNTTDRLLTLDKSDVSRSAVQTPEKTEPEHNNHGENNSISPALVENNLQSAEENATNSLRNNHSAPSHEQPSSSNPRPVTAPKIQKVSIV